MINIEKRLGGRRATRRIMIDWVFILPQLILFFTLTILPFFMGLPTVFTDKLSFVDANPEYVGLDNFTKVVTEPGIKDEVFPALVRTVRFTTLNYAMVYIFGLSLALLMYEVGFNGGFFTIIYLPMMLSGLAIGFIATMLFSQSTGTMNLLLMHLGVIDKPIDIKSASGISFILPLLSGWRYAGFNMAIFLSGLLTIPPETIEAAIVDGASYTQRLIYVYFPQMIPSFIIATIFCLIGSFNIFDELVALGGLYGNKEASFLSIIFFTYGFQRGRLAVGLTLALEIGIPLFIMGLLLQLLQRRLQYRS
ncbi:MAG TPA: sugar ABC transporter permease [Aggregatilinea sp.]|uniref:carbohydrate ABC transporter permease n=1 Tax=Aggregatilinea sp. TaxID=2806333 RepID=UPI002BC04791|nr:sugar ABC transporter permease [Aggregatilinea sp.]HML20893.1 sugar ABC transporter permease [Aggregatilinea sp.]